MIFIKTEEAGSFIAKKYHISGIFHVKNRPQQRLKHYVSTFSLLTLSDLGANWDLGSTYGC